MAARRNIKRRDWPRGLYETAPGYYVFRWTPLGGERQQLPIGRVPLQFAKDEAIAALAALSVRKPSLVQRLMGADNTLAMLVSKMPTSEKSNTAKTWRSMDKLILAALGPDTQVSAITVADCAKVLEGRLDQGMQRSAQAVRSRLVQLFKRAMALGWVERNPAEPTETPTPVIKRDRLTLEQFKAILAVAEGWLPRAMLLLLVTGQDRDTVAGMRYDMVRDGHLIVQRIKTAKTNQPVAIPLDIGIKVLGVTLRQLVEAPPDVPSEYLLHHIAPHSGAAPGDPIFRDRISKVFTLARKQAGIPDVMPNGKLAPTYYEVKSLAKRLYKEQGDVDTMHLFSHTDKTDALYADPRGVEPIYVRLLTAQ